MSVASLTLFPYGKQSFSINLLENIREDSLEQMISKNANVYIFSDLSYEFALTCGEDISVQDVYVYINDILEPSVYKDGQIVFADKETNGRRLFIDCYGFVKISLIVVDITGAEHAYSTEYIPVLVRRNELNEAVKAMVRYVYLNQEVFLMGGEPKARDLANLKEGGFQDLFSQIILAEEIADVYERSYGFFKANSQFKIEKVARIDRLERLQCVTSDTLHFIATHPEELRKVNSNVGIHYGNRIYQPEKVLSVQNVQSHDTYENQVVLGFIKKMISSLSELEKSCDLLLGQIPDNEEYSDEYIYSSFFMFMETKKMLENGANRLQKVQEKFVRLWKIYSNALNIRPDEMLQEPHPSPVFMSVPQYNRIFVQIHKWFTYGMYDFAKENYILSFIKISSLYERYLLVKMISYFQDRGYTLINAEKCTYPVRRGWKYQNTTCNNTFLFKKEQYQVTLYYQPVVYDTDKSSINGIELIRNNSLSSLRGNDTCQAGGHYYSPDYIIKVESDMSDKYLILDAKFSDLASVKRYYVKDLAFKYLFSISPVRTTASVVGLCLIYGKCYDSDQMQSVYDNRLPGQVIYPIAELLPMAEGISVENPYRQLDFLMREIRE